MISKYSDSKIIKTKSLLTFSPIRKELDVKNVNLYDKMTEETFTRLINKKFKLNFKKIKRKLYEIF